MSALKDMFVISKRLFQKQHIDNRSSINHNCVIYNSIENENKHVVFMFYIIFLLRSNMTSVCIKDCIIKCCITLKNI